MNHNFIFIVIAVVLAACGLAPGAEVRLKPQARASAGVIRLGDVAEIHAAEAWQHDQLAAIELGPAPAAGSRKFIRAREVQDALWLRGINVAEHRLSGSERIEVLGAGEPVVETPTVRVDVASRDRAKRVLNEAIIHYLNGQTGTHNPWQVDTDPSDDQVAIVLGSGKRIVATGGAAPWTGSQRFTVTIDGAKSPLSLPIDAEVTLPQAVVATARSLSIGTVLHESDLILKPVASLNDGLQPFYRVEEVVGQETTLSLPAGAILARGSVRRPIVIRRGDAVTLYARSAGLRVRTTVRAREDGALGSLIAVESLTNREAFYARVTGIQEAEIFAAPAEATTPTSSSPSEFGRRFAAQGGGQ